MGTVYPDNEKVWGVDVSFYQDENETPKGIDFNKMKAEGAKFAFIRAGQGPWVDEDFHVNWQVAKEAGLLRGAYWYLDARYNASSQGALFRSLLSDPGELKPVVDYECNLPLLVKDRKGKTKPVPTYNNIIQLNDFIKSLSWPINPIIYTGFYYWKDHGSIDQRWAGHDLWISRYEADKPMIPMPWKTWMFWQFTDSGPGKVLGAESSRIDLDYFNGDEADLLKYAGKIVPGPMVPSVNEVVITGEVNATWVDGDLVPHSVTKEIK